MCEPSAATGARRWHALASDDAMRARGTSVRGLDATEAGARLARFGPNRMPAPAPPSAGRILVRQLANPLVYVLSLALLLALVLGERADAVFIGAVIFLDA
ncbi:MAG TPA: cation-transporting P-type ATPase [Myxococcota bacterium]|nr:cation-transporting P-type ATPase [Myxococcota bacterium]